MRGGEIVVYSECKATNALFSLICHASVAELKWHWGRPQIKDVIGFNWMQVNSEHSHYHPKGVWWPVWNKLVGSAPFLVDTGVYITEITITVGNLGREPREGMGSGDWLPVWPQKWSLVRGWGERLLCHGHCCRAWSVIKSSPSVFRDVSPALTSFNNHSN